jgi:hypothetical protein
VLGIEQQGEHDIVGFCHHHPGHVGDLDRVGRRRHWPLDGIEHGEFDLGAARQQGTAPAPRPEGVDRRQRQQPGAKWNDRAMGG